MLGPYELNQVYTGDARKLAKAIPDGSVDLIFTDPVYDRIEDYDWLALTAARILKEGGNLVAQAAHYYLNQTLPVMSSHLDYIWQLFERTSGHTARLWKHRIMCQYKPWLWFAKGSRAGRWCRDWYWDSTQDKRFHKWGDGWQFVAYYIEALCSHSSVVVDPFAGGGVVPAVCKMLGYNYLAFEIDSEVAETARERIAQTQSPLFVLQPEQGTLL